MAPVPGGVQFLTVCGFVYLSSQSVIHAFMPLTRPSPMCMSFQSVTFHLSINLIHASIEYHSMRSCHSPVHTL